VEKRIGAGKTVDVEARKDGRRIAVEVETGKSDAVANILKDLEHGYEAVLSVALDKRTAEKIRAQIAVAGNRVDEKVVVTDIGRLEQELAALDALGTAGTARTISL